MPFLQVNIVVPSSHAELLSDELMEVGALSTAIEDAYAGTDKEQPIFDEPNEPSAEIWEQSLIIAMFDADTDVDAAVAALPANMRPVKEAYTITEVADQDWVKLTQSQFDPIHVSERLWITPTWHEAPTDGSINIELDPGLAFGTGSHPTTFLCLRWLDANMPQGATVLDYGCGSGILAITAAKLGASHVVGVDIDKQAIRASHDNAAQNNVSIDVYLPDAQPEGQFDVVVANILANPLRMLGQMLAGRVKNGGQIVLSGILAEQVDEISALYQQWFDMKPATIQDGWACLFGTKRA
ncbi:50S ribosomal protein L11 methyltransferase [Vitreoscilla massiliensis]|uniref:Ribosomal protein L11 methyltransferase n=1 Tax=Vitreoscilla massiliensis TaxID=1689272 RepID=A0ABY4E138_9NEIS|nr:50S ribosomal protein L11 methyltransferase [Vitreoscilla massiliensis]UOO89470.1 50S ribosomal protein L11 methyltransferase [Vitreoscilla massiliensis]